MTGTSPEAEPFAVGTDIACKELGISHSYIYTIRDELESYREGSRRKWTMRSIRRRRERLIAEANPQAKRRGRPRKVVQPAAVAEQPADSA
jgi:hypothetical protein